MTRDFKVVITKYQHVNDLRPRRARPLRLSESNFVFIFVYLLLSETRNHSTINPALMAPPLSLSNYGVLVSMDHETDSDLHLDSLLFGAESSVPYTMVCT